MFHIPPQRVLRGLTLFLCLVLSISSASAASALSVFALPSSVFFFSPQSHLVLFFLSHLSAGESCVEVAELNMRFCRRSSVLECCDELQFSGRRWATLSVYCAALHSLVLAISCSLEAFKMSLFRDRYSACFHYTKKQDRSSTVGP